MTAALAGRDFLTLMDHSRYEIELILNTAADLKRQWARREPHELLRGRTVALLFEKKSTRTRISFQVAVANLGGQSFYLRSEDMQLSRGEPIKDTARVIDRFCDVLVIRTFGQETAEEFAAYMNKPVINALTDLTHPCQGLADLLAIRERLGRLDGFKLAYVGDVWNVAHTLLVCGGTFGFDVFIAAPPQYRANERVLQVARNRARDTGANLVLTADLQEALAGADVVYANTLHSMGGPESNIEKRLQDYAGYQVNSETLGLARPGAIFMHPLPAYRGEEATDQVIEGPRSIVWEQAENRLHTAKAVLSLLVS